MSNASDIQAPNKEQLMETIRVMKDGLKAIDLVSINGSQAKAIAELQLFLKGLSRDAEAQYEALYLNANVERSK